MLNFILVYNFLLAFKIDLQQFIIIHSLIWAMEEFEETQINKVQIPVTFFIIILVLLIIIVRVKSKRRANPRNTLSKYQLFVPRNKIIVAIQIDNFFLEFRSRKTVDFCPMYLRDENVGIWNKLWKFFGFGYYYRLMYTPTKIKSFLAGLKELSNVQLFLYTSLDKDFVEAIITKYSLEQYFPQLNRRYCQQLSEDALKHASQIDTNTRRVMIITATHEDHSQQDSKYFLVLHNRRNKWSNFLRDSLVYIKNFLENIDSIDNLHDALAQLKVQVESDAQFQ